MDAFGFVDDIEAQTPARAAEAPVEDVACEEDCDDCEGPHEESKDADDVEDVVVARTEGDVIAERLAKTKALRARRKKQAIDLLDCVCDEPLDVGSHRVPTHEFAQCLKKESIEDLSALLLMKREDFDACGHELPHTLEKRICWLDHFVENPATNQQDLSATLRVLSLTHESFVACAKKMSGPRAVPVDPVGSPTIDVGMVPSAGRDSNAGKLLESRRKSVSFTAGDGGAGANVTQRKSSTGSHPGGSGGGRRKQWDWQTAKTREESTDWSIWDCCRRLWRWTTSC